MEIAHAQINACLVSCASGIAVDRRRIGWTRPAVTMAAAHQSHL
jgi:hypothetical protein